MRRTEKRTEPPKEYDALVEIACDLCGAQTQHYHDGRALDSWRTGSFDVNEVTVEHRTGTSYPEGGSSTTAGFDICPTCWETKLVPWLASQNAHPHTTDHDY